MHLFLKCLEEEEEEKKVVVEEVAVGGEEGPRHVTNDLYKGGGRQGPNTEFSLSLGAAEAVSLKVPVEKFVFFFILRSRFRATVSTFFVTMRTYFVIAAILIAGT